MRSQSLSNFTPPVQIRFKQPKQIPINCQRKTAETKKSTQRGMIVAKFICLSDNSKPINLTLGLIAGQILKE